MTPSRPVTMDRGHTLEQLAHERFDLLVIGGGITAAWVALDAATRGMTVALVEKDDFASGTSSKSSKMIHGGLRYIEQGNLNLVRHSLLERQRLRRNAPHLVQRLPFLFPVMDQDGVFDPRLARAFEGLLWTYDVAGGWRIGRLHERLTREQVLAYCPTLRPERLREGLLYFDARADDARLTLAVVRTAAWHGAVVANGVAAGSLLRDKADRVVGLRAHADEGDFDIQARAVVNATGVWADDPHLGWSGETTLRPAKGVHLVVPWRLVRNSCTVTVRVPGRSRRATITRWGDVSYLGTTDTDYRGPLEEVLCTAQEQEFLLTGINTALSTHLTPDDVIGSWGGVRPLVGKRGGQTVDMSRDHHIADDGTSLVHVTGGKLTTGRQMGEQVVDRVLGLLGRRASCRTRSLPLLGGAGFDAEASAASGGLAAHLGGRYGTEARFVHELVAQNPRLGERLVPGLDYVKAEAVYAARHEMARNVGDVLSRRTRARILARDASASVAAQVGELIAPHLGLTDVEVKRQVESYCESVDRERAVLN